jgi:hypothetical protein
MNSVIFIVKHANKELWRTETLPWDVVFKGNEPYHILNLDRLSPNEK